MSVVSAVFPSRASGINARVASLMDSIFAIGAGLGLRFVVDIVSHHDFKLTGTLVGLWEGVIMLHFLKKMPSSFDPYIAYAVRLFIDFLFTESVSRLVLVLVWTGLGMVLADVIPTVWREVGLHRIWRRFRRDMYIISRSVPSISLFPKSRTVRFSPTRTPSVASPRNAAVPSTSSPTAAAPTHRRTSSTLAPPRRRVFPGSFPGEASETETEIGSILGQRVAPQSESSTGAGVQHRFSVFPSRTRLQRGYGTEISSGKGDLDEGNISSSASSAPSSADHSNLTEIPDLEEPIEVNVKGKQPDRGSSSRPNSMALPLTPADSVALGGLFYTSRQIPEEIQPPVAEVPNIPDHFDGGDIGRGWENVEKENHDVHMPPPSEHSNLPPIPPKEEPIPSVPLHQQTGSSNNQPVSPHRSPAGWVFTQNSARPLSEHYQKEPSTVRGDQSKIPAPPIDKPLSPRPAPPGWVITQNSARPTTDPRYKQAPSESGIQPKNSTALLDLEDTRTEPPSRNRSKPTTSERGLPSSKAALSKDLEDLRDTRTEPPSRNRSRPPSKSTTPLPPVPKNKKDTATTEPPSQNPAKPPSSEKGLSTSNAAHQFSEDLMDFGGNRTDNRTPPPSFQDVYAQDHPLTSSNPADSATNYDTNDKGQDDGKNRANETVKSNDNEANMNVNANANANEGEKGKGAEEATQAGDGKSEAGEASDNSSVATTTPSKRLSQTLALRREAIALKERLPELKRQRKAAQADGADGAAIVLERTRAIELVEKEMKKVGQKVERRYLAACGSAGGPAASPQAIDMTGLSPDEAIAKMEITLELHLKPGQRPTNMEVTTGPGKFGKAQRLVLFEYLKQLELSYRSDSKNIRSFTVNLENL